ncbi:MAG: hypothetical protein ACO4AC_09885 [Pseudohongiellaceae bacterium]
MKQNKNTTCCPKLRAASISNNRHPRLAGMSIEAEENYPVFLRSGRFKDLAAIRNDH